MIQERYILRCRTAPVGEFGGALLVTRYVDRADALQALETRLRIGRARFPMELIDVELQCVLVSFSMPRAKGPFCRRCGKTWCIERPISTELSPLCIWCERAELQAGRDNYHHNLVSGRH